MARPSVMPYMLLTQLLYVREPLAGHIEVEGSTRVAAVGPWARHNRMTPAALCHALEFLELEGYISDFSWKSHYVIIRGVGNGLIQPNSSPTPG
jgi:hypothetical protein